MKVGILNFHCAHNYGAMLQAYALQEYVKKNNDVEIIDFQPKEIKFSYELYNPKILLHPRRLISTILNFKDKKMKYDVFENFKKESMILSKEYKRIKKVDKYNTIICGSDQVWNMDLNGGLTEYLLSFAGKNVKRVSYAASIGTNDIKDEFRNVMKSELDKFLYISVREDTAVQILKNKLNIDSIQVLDPVFLLSKEQWNKIEIKPLIRGKYVLLYGLEENELFEKTFKFIKDNTDYKIINISPMKKSCRYIDETLYKIGPKEFIGLIKNAEIVFTNSFHGTCFSIIYEKKFFTIAHSQLNSRIESILKLTNLEKHMINKEFTSIKEFKKVIKSDFNEVQKVLKEEIRKSKNFLDEALK